MKYSIFLLIMVAAFSLPFSLSAAPKGKKGTIPADVPQTFSAREKAWLKSALSDEFLLERTKAIAREFVQQKELHIPRLKLAIQELKTYEKYYFLEHDSKISRRWVVQNIAFAEALLKAKAKMNFLIMRKQTGSDEYRRWYEYYTKTAKQYWTISQRPVKITDRRKLSEMARVKKLVLARELAREQSENDKKPVLDDKKLPKL